MLKIFKYEWNRHFNYVKLTLAAGVLSSVVLGLILNLLDQGAGDSLGFPIAAFVWFGIMTALFIMTILCMVESLTKQMYGTEGYYIHLLPVSAKELVAGKALGNWVFGVFMAAYAFLSCVIVGGIATFFSGEMGDSLRFIAESLRRLTPWHFGVAVYGMLVCLAATAFTVLAFQFVFAVSHQFGRFSLLGGLIAFWAVNAVVSKLAGKLTGILVYALVGAGCYFATVYLEEKRLSVG